MCVSKLIQTETLSVRLCKHYALADLYLYKIYLLVVIKDYESAFDAVTL